MLTELRLELFKLLRKPRTYIGPASMAALTTLVLIGMKYGNEFRYMHHRLERDFYVAGTMVNAAFLARSLMEVIVYTFLPLFACMVCGDLIASEAADGTLRMLLCRPITRFRVFGSKYAVAVAYALALTFGTGIAAYLAGVAFLGRGSLVVFTDGIWILPERLALQRIALAYAVAAVGMVAIGSIAFAISTFLSNSNGAIAGAMGFLFGSAVIGQIGYFAKLKPYLLTTHLEVWRDLFAGNVNVPDLTHSLGVMMIYSAVAFLIGAVIFQRRDVLS